jgi:hypothetical protein
VLRESGGLGAAPLVDHNYEFTLDSPLRLPLYSVAASANFGAIGKQIIADLHNAGGSQGMRAWFLSDESLKRL